MREIEIDKYFTNNYLVLNIYIKSYLKEKSVVIYIRQKIYVVNYLKIKMLLEINIIIFKRIIVNLNSKKLTINNCRELIVNLEVTTRDNTRVYKVLKTSKLIIINANIIIKIFICLLQFLINKDYLFDSILVNAYTYIVDFNIFLIYIYNTNLMSIIINKYINLDCLTKYKEQDYY